MDPQTEEFLDTCRAAETARAKMRQPEPAGAPPRDLARDLPDLDLVAMGLTLSRLRSGTWTQGKLAALAGVAHGMVSAWESGDRAPPLWGLVRVAQVLGVQVSDLIRVKGRA